MGENRRNRRKFTDEFKRDAVKLVDSSGRPIAEIAREPGHLRLHPGQLGASGPDRLRRT
ncbi:MAG: transposase [Egibacteraceae bacterium]